jgi:Ca2+-binding EF-hand superfamily protein
MSERMKITMDPEDPLLLKFRGLFPEKSPAVLSDLFCDMTNSVYQGKAAKTLGVEGYKMTEQAKNRWGSVAAKFRSLNLIEFKIAMYRFRAVGLTFEEIRRIFLWLDTSGNGRVEYDEFVVGIRGELSRPRQRIVVFVFRKLDKNLTGFIEESELTLHLRKATLPDILEGIKTPQAKAKEFISMMGTPMNGTIVPEGNISVEQMVDYYLTRTLEQSMSDEEFKTLVVADWGVDSSDASTSVHDNSPAAVGLVAVAPSTPAPSNPCSVRKAPIGPSIVRMHAESEKPSAAVAAEQYNEQFQKQYQNLASPRRASTANVDTESYKRGTADDVRANGGAASTRIPSTPTVQTALPPANGTYASGNVSPSMQRKDNGEQMVNSLNLLVASLHSKVEDLQQMVQNQQSIITTQQQMLGQLQMIIQHHQNQTK